MNEELKTPEDHLFKTFHRSDDWDFRVIIPDVTEGQRFRHVPVKSVGGWTFHVEIKSAYLL